MSKPRRRIRKEDIGDPTNFVHVEGYGRQQKPMLHTQRSLDLEHVDNDRYSPERRGGRAREVSRQESYLDDDFKLVERRHKGSRHSKIPRHHRSTTAGIFSENELYAQGSGLPKTDSIETPEVIEKNAPLRPSFGSLLNLSFLPLGLGKSSSKGPAAPSKAKRTSLLNLTASNLFTNSPRESLEEKRESVHMTSFTRRRSFSNSGEGDDTSVAVTNPGGATPELGAPTSGKSAPVQLLAKLGRSKSNMTELTKRPKLRLKIAPPVPPPPVPSVHHQKATPIVEALPSPPPSPPTKAALTAPVLEERVMLRRPSKSPPRSRIIPLPSTGSLDSAEPASPQYLTPAGGSSPLPNDSPFPLLSPTLPPTNTPLFSQHQRSPGTPPVWPLQPLWPTTFVPQTHSTIMEVPTPCKEEMETSEYDPVLSIVESFIGEQQSPGTRESLQYNLPLNSVSIGLISRTLSTNVPHRDWADVTKILFSSAFSGGGSGNKGAHVKELYECVLRKTLELWVETSGNLATVENLASALDDVNHNAAEMLRQMSLRD